MSASLGAVTVLGTYQNGSLSQETWLLHAIKKHMQLYVVNVDVTLHGEGSVNLPRLLQPLHALDISP
jgi:hypothetical protein